MPPTPDNAIATFCRRVAVGALAAGALRAVSVVGVAAAALLLLLRLFGLQAAPQPAWAATAVPVLAFAWWSLRRQRLDRAAGAVHLDRRLRLGGLLICSHEGVVLDAPQRQRLATGLAGLPAVLPRLRWRALLPWPALALLLAVGVALLPPPPAPPLPLQRAAAGAELERLEERMRDLLTRGEVPEDAQRDLAQKLQELQQKLAAAEVPEWRELDELERRLDREQLLQAAAAAPPPAAAGAAAAPGSELSPARLAAAAEALAAAGLLDGLPADVQAMLQQARRADGSLAAAGLPQDADALRRLAEAMAAAALQPGALQEVAALGDGQLADLRDVLSPAGGAGGLPGVGPGAGDPGGEGEGVGRGGVDRGPGHAALALTEDAQGAAAGVMPLPPGQPVPGEWVPIGSRRVEPETAPVANTAAGGQGAAGAGGASWQLQLAPHHRAVVRRFFTAGAPPGDGNANGKDKR